MCAPVGCRKGRVPEVELKAGLLKRDSSKAGPPSSVLFVDLSGGREPLTSAHPLPPLHVISRRHATQAGWEERAWIHGAERSQGGGGEGANMLTCRNASWVGTFSYCVLLFMFFICMFVRFFMTHIYEFKSSTLDNVTLRKA